jgi:hypothetical protein
MHTALAIRFVKKEKVSCANENIEAALFVSFFSFFLYPNILNETLPYNRRGGFYRQLLN